MPTDSTIPDITKIFGNYFQPETINSITKIVQEAEQTTQEAECDDECEIQKLRLIWVNNKNTQFDIPEKVKSSHKDWCIKAYGEDEYENYLDGNSSTKCGVLANLQNDDNRNDDNRRTNTLSPSYEISDLENTKSKLEDYKNKLEKEKKILMIKLDRISGDINKNNRMFDYENIEIENILSSRYIVLFLYYILFIIYILFGNFRKKIIYKNNKILFFIILYSIFPFLINRILYITYSRGNRCRGGSKGDKRGECNFLFKSVDGE